MQARTFDVNSSRVYNTRRKSQATRGGALLFFFLSFFLFFLPFFHFLPSEDVNFFLIGSNLRRKNIRKYRAFPPFPSLPPFFSSSVSFLFSLSLSKRRKEFRFASRIESRNLRRIFDSLFFVPWEKFSLKKCLKFFPSFFKEKRPLKNQLLYQTFLGHDSPFFQFPR